MGSEMCIRDRSCLVPHSAAVHARAPPPFPTRPTPQVERYGSVEQSIRKMVSLVQSDQHEAIDDTELNAIESEISDMILQLGLQQDPESFTWRGAYEAALVGLNRALQVRAVSRPPCGGHHPHHG